MVIHHALHFRMANDSLAHKVFAETDGLKPVPREVHPILVMLREKIREKILEHCNIKQGKYATKLKKRNVMQQG